MIKRRIAILLLLAAVGNEVWASDASPVFLVEFGGDAAVFRDEGGMQLVRAGARVPGTPATLMHVGSRFVLVEFPASATRPGAVQRLSRGQRVQPLSAEQLQAPKDSAPQLDAHLIAAPPGTPVPPQATEGAETQR